MIDLNADLGEGFGCRDIEYDPNNRTVRSRV